MTFAPPPLRALARSWVAQGGVNLGVVGGPRHKSGYHLGRDRIFRAGGQGAADYSIQLPRDKPFLTNAASAIDLGRLNGTLEGLQRFSTWLVERCRAETEAYRDVREVIYSPDGRRVERWDNGVRRLFPAGTGTGQGDDSHLTHTHISFFRDSEARPKVALFAPFFAGGDTAMAFALSLSRAMVKTGAPFFDRPEGAEIGTMSRAMTVTVLGIPLDRSTDSSPGRLDTWRAVLVTTAALDRTSAPKAVYMRRADLTPAAVNPAWDASLRAALNDPTAPVSAPDTTPFRQTDLDRAIASTMAQWEAWVGRRPK